MIAVAPIDVSKTGMMLLNNAVALVPMSLLLVAFGYGWQPPVIIRRVSTQWCCWRTTVAVAEVNKSGLTQKLEASDQAGKDLAKCSAELTGKNGAINNPPSTRVIDTRWVTQPRATPV